MCPTGASDVVLCGLHDLCDLCDVYIFVPRIVYRVITCFVAEIPLLVSPPRCVWLYVLYERYELSSQHFVHRVELSPARAHVCLSGTFDVVLYGLYHLYDLYRLL